MSTVATCPACSAKRSTAHPETPGVRVCSRCGAIFTERRIYRGDSYSLVLPYFDESGACEPGDERYFDFDVLGSDGLSRRHGWFNPKTRKITQVG